MLEFGQKNEICDKMAPGLLANLSFCQVKKIDFFNPGEKLGLLKGVGHWLSEMRWDKLRKPYMLRLG